MSNRTLKKTTSIPLKKTNSMAKEANFPPKSPPLVEFPTSPYTILGEAILHFSHPHHLSKVDLPDLFTCSGCKEYGSGKRFTCRQCDFQLHDFCGLAPSSLNSHPLHMQHQLQFSAKPVKGGILKSKCDVCGKSAKGYTFKCNACGYQMHPCCAMLSNEMEISVHPHRLKIMPQMSLQNGENGYVCGECNKTKRSGRVYRCTVCEYYVHAVCAKNMVNGLQANGYKGVEKPGMFGSAARIASQVIIEFIGGLIEGLGEGVGEALIQSVARGRRPSSSSSSSSRPPIR